MNKELALRTLAYLKGQYKANGEIIINKEEIKAIDFILDDNKQLIDLINEYENKGYDIAQERADFLLEIQDLQQQLDKYKNVIDKIKEYVKENTRYYDDELGLVEIMGAGATRIPVVYLYGLLELLEEVE